MTEVRMPKLGDAVTDGLLADIYVDEGGHVTEGEPLYLVETDKTEVEIDAPATGTVRWKVAPQETYDVGELLAVIE